RQVLNGEPIHPTDIRPLVVDVLNAEPRPSSLETAWPWLATACPQLAAQERKDYSDIANIIRVQAHPPVATLLTVPLYYYAGIYMCGVVLAVASLVSIAAVTLLVRQGLRLKWTASQWLLVFLVFAGWYPMYWVI